MNWRTIGDVTYETWRNVITSAGGPAGLASEPSYTAATPHSALILAMAGRECRWGTRENLNKLANRNVLNLKQPLKPDETRLPGFMAFTTWDAGIRAARERITSTTYGNGIYVPTRTVHDLVSVFAPSIENDVQGYVDFVQEYIRKWAMVQPAEEEEPPVVGNVNLFIDQRLTSRDLGFLDGGTGVKAYITIHNNGNINSMRYDEAGFVQSGGGTESVLYHGALDAGGLCQIEKLDRRGRHSANDLGNAVSLGFEMCEGSEPWSQTEENMAQALAAIVLGDPRLDYGRLSPANFSLDRVVEHRDWGRTVGIGQGIANPNCPRRVIASDGAIDNRILPRARAIVKAAQEETKPTPIPNPSTFVKPILTWMDDDIEKGTPSDHTWTTTIKGESVAIEIFGAEREYEVLKSTWRYQRPESGGAKVGPRLAVRESFTGSYIATVGKTRWICTRWGSWILASTCTPRVSVRAA